MKRVLKKYFIPHADNNYHPHILHTKRAIFYGAVFLILKLIVVLFVLALPARVFVLDDVLANEQKKIIALTNELREQKGLKPLIEVAKLDLSAQNKADDMAKYSYFSHTSKEQKTVSDLVRGSGYSYSVVGENLAMGFSGAGDLMNAWIKSPTHYANLVDTDFLEFGAGLESGEYDGIDTVYVAEHFAAPRVVEKVSAKTVPVTQVKTTKINVVPAVENTVSAKEVPLSPPAVVLAEKEIVAPSVVKEEVFFNSVNSHVYWLEDNGKTNLYVRAEIFGEVKSGAVVVGGHTIQLARTEGNRFDGKLTVDEPADNFFRVIISPVIKIIGKDGKLTESLISWYNVKVASPSPWQIYFHAKNTLDPITNIFSVSRIVYLAIIIFFTLVLVLNIFIEIKKQHYHIILQTTGLLGLLFALYLV